MISQLGISNAKDQLLDQQDSGAPSLYSTLQPWFRKITLTKITKTIVDFQVKEIEYPQETFGMMQPMSPRRVAIKPEGQRAWEWQTLHCTPDFVLKPDEVVEYRGTRYRVSGKTNWREYGFVEYELVNDYTRSRTV